MNQWTFVVAAYLVALVGVVTLVIGSFVAMRKAEAGAERGGTEDR